VAKEQPAVQMEVESAEPKAVEEQQVNGATASIDDAVAKEQPAVQMEVESAEPKVVEEQQSGGTAKADDAVAKDQPVAHTETDGVAAATQLQQPAQASRRRQSTGKATTKRKRDRDTEELSARVERLQRVVQQEAAVLKEKAAALERATAEFRRQEEILASARRSAAKVQQELAALQMPEAREKPKTAFLLFAREMKAMLPPCQGPGGFMKKITPIWGAMGDGEKKKYKDAYEAELKEYNVWANSGEGRAILSKRREVQTAQKMSQKEDGSSVCAVGEALAAAEACVQEFGQEFGQEALRAKQADGSAFENAKDPEVKSTPVKQRRMSRTPAKTPLPASVPEIEEQVLQEASNLALDAQLINLASRTEVQALKKSSHELLDALKKNDGMVNAAKRCLLDAAV